MSPFKTHEELGLSKRQWTTLIRTCNLLSSGQVHHEKSGLASHIRKRLFGPKDSMGFNMNKWMSKSSCGTVCCIGGWAETIAGDPIFSSEFAYYPWQLKNLFYPFGLGQDWGFLTTEEAAVALCHYLKTGQDGTKCWLIATGHAGSIK